VSLGDERSGERPAAFIPEGCSMDAGLYFDLRRRGRGREEAIGFFLRSQMHDAN
jgi:hypothetical protein